MVHVYLLSVSCRVLHVHQHLSHPSADGFHGEHRLLHHHVANGLHTWWERRGEEERRGGGGGICGLLHYFHDCFIIYFLELLTVCSVVCVVYCV